MGSETYHSGHRRPLQGLHPTDHAAPVRAAGAAPEGTLPCPHVIASRALALGYCVTWLLPGQHFLILTRAHARNAIGRQLLRELIEVLDVLRQEGPRLRVKAACVNSTRKQSSPGALIPSLEHAKHYWLAWFDFRKRIEKDYIQQYRGAVTVHLSAFHKIFASGPRPGRFLNHPLVSIH
eukprot:1157862-Pelagomonas_calceolata.AAC.7